MVIENIELHEIHPPLQSFNRNALRFQLGTSYDTRTIIVLKTDTGLEGLGEVVGQADPELRDELERLRGTNPAIWLGNPTLRAGIAPAIYDLVGKHNGVPSYALFGPKVRSWVPFGYWTVSQTPDKMAGEVENVTGLGYTWLKYHTDPFHNVIDQTEAMQAVAPRGFKIHYDVNFDNSAEQVLDMARELASYPVAGLVEDPLRPHDFEGYRLLRARCPLPIVFHHLPLGGNEALAGLADGYMLGHAPVGQVISRAGLFAALNTPFMLQNVGGAITRALMLHMAAVFQMATMHHVTDSFSWEEDVVDHPFEVVGGTISVPESPGLGITLDRSALERLKKASAAEMPRALIKVTTQRGLTFFGRPPRSRRDHLALDPERLPGFDSGYCNQSDMVYWVDDDSQAFESLWERTGQEVVVTEENS